MRRTAQLERGEKQGTIYRFPMTLATEGEASDGHVLSIKGGEVPERLPLLVSHWNDPTMQLGSVVDPRKEAKTLRAFGEIELGGEGPGAAIRRDIAHMIDEGHVAAVSLRWDPIKSKPRASLPETHPAHVFESETNWAKRYGLFFESWRALEGSVVAVPADAKAKIGGRKFELADDPTVGAFWRAFLAAELAADVPPIETAVSVIADGVRAAKVAGVAELEIGAALAQAFGFHAVEIDGVGFHVPPEVAKELATRRGEIDELLRAAAKPPEPARPTEPAREVLTAQDLAELLDQHEQKIRARMSELFAKATGRRI